MTPKTGIAMGSLHKLVNGNSPLHKTVLVAADLPSCPLSETGPMSWLQFPWKGTVNQPHRQDIPIAISMILQPAILQPQPEQVNTALRNAAARHMHTQSLVWKDSGPLTSPTARSELLYISGSWLQV
ncbi:hypothetical protein J1614_001543 [Plenodomus biglobosus]|nr:hypothetical protein J1614_001543 [Plenodomus biglobosus]